jgi:hypothetical protein
MMSKNAGMDTVGLIFSFVTLGILIWAIVDLGIKSPKPSHIRAEQCPLLALADIPKTASLFH